MQQQFDWLKDTLAKYSDKPIMLVTHHHLLANQCTMPIWPGTPQLLELLRPYHVTAILNGHTHHPFVGQINQAAYFTAPSMSFIGIDQAKKVRFEERFGYHLYHVDHGLITHQTLENFIPNKLLKTLSF